MKRSPSSIPRSTRRGGALILCLIAAAVLAAMAGVALSVTMSSVREIETTYNNSRSLYLAESGIGESLRQLAIAEAYGTTPPTTIASADSPLRLTGGSYFGTLVSNGDGTYTATSTGSVNRSTETVQAILGPVGESVFDHAIFAGNRGGDPAYTLRLGGVGVQGDEVIGDVYTGGDVELTGDASVVGGISAGGTITGAVGEEGASRPLPDIAGMDYENNHDFDVAALFVGATFEANDAGGSAWQLPEDNPAHIFRKNPDNRATETGSTDKDDFFLEDPYETLDELSLPSGDATKITLSGMGGHPGPAGNEKVYFVDGNLWVHNLTTLRFVFHNDAGEPVRVTFVVKGNVYFSDDVRLQDDATDGVAFIAIEDEAVANSGNIYLGDPEFGTIERMEAYLYAENDFVDYNLDEDGSSVVTIMGNMTAGNHVDIERDYVDSDGDAQHSKLVVEFDDRLSTGALELPGLPGMGSGTTGYRVLAWRTVPDPN